MKDEEFKFEITEHIATIGERGKWSLELNRVIWKDNPEKLDLRTWNEDHTKMGKGIAFTHEEAARLYEVLEEII